MTGGSFGGDGNFVWDKTGAKLTVTGNIDYTGVITDVSDRRKKENITPLQGSLDGILTLNGYSFTMKDDPKKEIEYGLIAQEVEPVFPELVKTKPDGFKTLNYIGLIAPLVEAVKTQNAEIQALKSEIEQLKTRLPDQTGGAK